MGSVESKVAALEKAGVAIARTTAGQQTQQGQARDGLASHPRIPHTPHTPCRAALAMDLEPSTAEITTYRMWN